jgi:hypothetical protein
MVTIDNDNLVPDDEVHVPTPFRVDLDNDFRDFDDPHGGRHDGAHRDRKVGARNTGGIPSDQDSLPDFTPLLGCQCCAPAGAALASLGSATLGPSWTFGPSLLLVHLILTLLTRLITLPLARRPGSVVILTLDAIIVLLLGLTAFAILLRGILSRRALLLPALARSVVLTCWSLASRFILPALAGTRAWRTVVLRAGRLATLRRSVMLGTLALGTLVFLARCTGRVAGPLALRCSTFTLSAAARRALCADKRSACQQHCRSNRCTSHLDNSSGVGSRTRLMALRQ